MNSFAKDVFDRYAAVYDQTRRQLIPCFDNFYGGVINALPFPEDRPICVLDLGAGTGLLSAFILARYPQARLTLVDTSGEMLARARQRFGETGGKVSYHELDYSQEIPSGSYDAVVSALSIHHLDEAQKLSLFKLLPGLLAPGGIFINADQVMGETPEQDSKFRAAWLDSVQANGVTKTDLAAAQERMKADRMSTLSMQLDGLRSAGFMDVRSVFQDQSFVVFLGHTHTET